MEDEGAIHKEEGGSGEGETWADDEKKREEGKEEGEEAGGEKDERDHSRPNCNTDGECADGDVDDAVASE